MNNKNMPYYKSSVYQIQNYLLSISKTDSDVPRVNPDGIYGSTTRESVKAFQRKYMQHSNGKVDFSTWQALYSVFKSAEEVLAEPSKADIFPSFIKNGVIEEGDSNDTVAVIKTMLRELGKSYPLGSTLTLNDSYDSELKNAVASFQNLNGLNPTGKTDKITWNSIVFAYKALPKIE